MAFSGMMFWYQEMWNTSIVQLLEIYSWDTDFDYIGFIQIVHVTD